MGRQNCVAWHIGFWVLGLGFRVSGLGLWLLGPRYYGLGGKVLGFRAESVHQGL